MGGGMEAHKNRFIEEWGSARENLEYNFRWTRRNLALVGLFGIAIPVFIYKGIVKEFVCRQRCGDTKCRNVECDICKSKGGSLNGVTNADLKCCSCSNDNGRQ